MLYYHQVGEKVILSPVIETERLLLRRFNESDIDVFYAILHDKKLANYVQFPKLTKDEEFEYIKSSINEADTSKYEKWAIELKNSAVVIGNISVNSVNKHNNYCTIGYVIRYEYWGNGYAAEALNAVSNYLLTERGYFLVEAFCHELNTQSIRVLEKCGFKKDGYIANRRLNEDGTYSGINFFSKIL